MHVTTYTPELRRMLTEGTGQLAHPLRLRLTDRLLATQASDGGFPGRLGSSDLYYAGFAARSAGLLEIEKSSFWEGLWTFLYRGDHVIADVAQAVSALLVRSELDRAGRKACCPDSEKRFIDGTLSVVERFRHPDGGYAKRIGGPVSTYHTFLAALCFESAGRPLSEPDRIGELVLRHRGREGGFSDVVSDEVEGTNATAAAVSLLELLDALDGQVARDARDFLIRQQRDDGGFAASPGTPAADLMSTFTALLTLVRLDAKQTVRMGAVGRYVKKLALPEGGFAGAVGDRTGDIEYLYYGLGTLALLARHVARAKPVQERIP